jgi:hypothetical protein
VTDDFTLTEHDKASSLWRRLEAHLLDMLASARVRNDNEALTEQETATLRGRIKCLRSLLALADDRPIVTGNAEQPPAY